jgi:DUF1680 family protein
MQWAESTLVAPHVAVTGLEGAMLDLHLATGDRRYLDFVLKQRALAEWDLPIVVGRRPGIDGHIYGYMTRALAQLELYRLRPQSGLLVPARRAVDFMTRGDGMSITGGAGQWEIWTDDQDGRGELAETCATAYQIRVYESLLRLTGEVRFGDLMERTIFNTLFAAQSPDGRSIRYYTPFEGPRKYHPTDNMCCPNNYRMIVSELPEFIYYKSGSGVTVNLYTASSATLDAGGVRLSIRQETDYPSSGAVSLHLSPSQPAVFSLRFRIPGWASDSRVRVNDAPPQDARAGSFFEVNRQWRSGDTIRIEMPMRMRLIAGRQRQAGRAAVMRGPLVFCLNPADQKSLANLDGVDLGRFTLDPASLAAVPDNGVRPNGIACQVSIWKPSHSLQLKPEMSVRLTEFTDPGGTATYFRLRDLSVVGLDELLNQKR